MVNMIGITASQVKKANVEYHARMAACYEKTQPYFTRDNIRRLHKIISIIGKKSKGKGIALDIGCGTGFLMRIAKKYFSKVYGIDITEKMLEKIPKSKKLIPILADSEKIPFKNNFFDACFSYSFLHHLYDLEPTLKEIYRVLKPGGIYFNDQDFNKEYFALSEKIDFGGNSWLRTEMKSRDFIEREVAVKYKLKPEIIKLAEFQELQHGGFTVEELEKKLKNVGFRKVIIKPRWFVGQARIQKECGMKVAKEIDAYLLKCYPISKGFFKYLSFEAIK